MKPQVPEAFAAFVGLDWADAKHDICLQVAGSTHREFLRREHRPEAIDAWVCTLCTRFNGQPIAVCLELNKGPIVSALQNNDFLVLFSVNPLTVPRYRKAFTPSQAKDDPTDGTGCKFWQPLQDNERMEENRKTRDQGLYRAPTSKRSDPPHHGVI